MLEIRITAPELSEAINNLARLLTGRAETTPIGTANSVTHINTTSAPVNGQTEPQQATPTEAGVNPAPTQAVPTAPPQYTLEMIAKAGTELIDAGKMNKLTALLAKYGVEVLTNLDPTYYGAFANELRALGASI